MIVAQIREISRIDSKIAELHDMLDTLYRKRAEIVGHEHTGGVANENDEAETILDALIDLDSIDLSVAAGSHTGL